MEFLVSLRVVEGRCDCNHKLSDTLPLAPNPLVVWWGTGSGILRVTPLQPSMLLRYSSFQDSFPCFHALLLTSKQPLDVGQGAELDQRGTMLRQLGF